MIGKSHLIMAAALAACASGVGGFAYGTGVGRNAEIASQRRADQAAAKVRDELQGQIDAAAIASQSKEYARQQSIREINNETIKIIEKPVYRNICIDADGVRLLDGAQALANGDGESAAQPLGTAAAPAASHAQP